MSSKIDMTKVEKLYIEDKLPIRTICKQLGYGYGTLQKTIKKAGLTRDKIKNTKSQKILDLKAQIKKLYVEDKLSSYKIAEKLNLSAKTITYHLNDLGVELRPVKKIDQVMFEKLWLEGKTDKEIADYFEVTELTIKTFRTKGKNAGKFNIKRYFSQEEHELSEEQEQMILGSLLGDLSLSYKEKQNARLAIVHCSKQEELFMKKVEILGEFMGNYKFTLSKVDDRTNKIYESWRGNSKTHSVFTKIYKLLYPNNIKTVTEEYLNKITNPIALAYWFMDDGSVDGALATNCFSFEEQKLMQKWLLLKWGITVNIHPYYNQYLLKIDKESRLKWEQLIFPYMVPSMYYKLKYLEQLQNNTSLSV